MKRRAIIGLATIATLGGCSDRASLDVATPDDSETTDVVVQVAAETPEACRDTLTKADALLDIAIDAMGKGSEAIVLASDTVGAIVDLDVDTMEALVPQIEAIGVWFEDKAPAAGAARTAYDTAKAACLNP